jgi:hypothetical protein
MWVSRLRKANNNLKDLQDLGAFIRMNPDTNCLSAYSPCVIWAFHASQTAVVDCSPRGASWALPAQGNSCLRVTGPRDVYFGINPTAHFASISIPVGQILQSRLPNWTPPSTDAPSRRVFVTLNSPITPPPPPQALNHTPMGPPYTFPRLSFYCTLPVLFSIFFPMLSSTLRIGSARSGLNPWSQAAILQDMSRQATFNQTLPNSLQKGTSRKAVGVGW